MFYILCSIYSDGSHVGWHGQRTRFLTGMYKRSIRSSLGQNFEKFTNDGGCQVIVELYSRDLKMDIKDISLSCQTYIKQYMKDWIIKSNTGIYPINLQF